MATFCHEVLEECKRVQGESGKLLKDFTIGLAASAPLVDIKRRVMEWSEHFPMPGIDVVGL